MAVKLVMKINPLVIDKGETRSKARMDTKVGSPSMPSKKLHGTVLQEQTLHRRREAYRSLR